MRQGEIDLVDYMQTVNLRLLSKAIPVENHNYVKPCLQFTGCTRGGYGRISVKSKLYDAHRVSYAIDKGILVKDIPLRDDNGNILQVCHGKQCTRLCIEPTHLELKTNSENIYDDRHRDKTIPKGEAHPKASITEALALQIKH